jgi:hypothetical protein
MTWRQWDDDEQLLAELAGALSDPGPVAAEYRDAGHGAFAWRTIDEDLALAALAYDSLLDDGLLTRARSQTAPRAMVFSGEELSVEIQVTADGLVGQLVPGEAGEVRMLGPAGEVAHTSADEIGCFLLPAPPPGPVRLSCRMGDSGLITEWFCR